MRHACGIRLAKLAGRLENLREDKAPAINNRYDPSHSSAARLFAGETRN